MTDEQYLSDLESIGQSLPATPGDYAQLRSLLESLPPGTAPDVRSARAGAAAPATGGSIGGDLTIQSSTPIGSESGIAVGVDQAPTLGLRNLFDDPRQNSVPFASVALGAAFTGISRDWRAKFAAGTTGAGASIFKGVDYDNATQDAFQSGTMILRFNNWTAAGTAVITANSDNQGGFFATYDSTVLPFVVFSCTIFKDATWNQQFTNVTSLIIELVIRDGSDTTDIAVSTPIDYKNLGIGKYVRRWVSADSAALSSTGYIATVRVTMVTSGTLGGGNVNPSIADPQFELSPYQLPTVFLPAPRNNQSIAFTNPSAAGFAVKAAAGAASPGAFSSFRSNVALTLSNLNEGSVEFGGNAGADNDIRLRRIAAGNLRIDTLSATPDFLIQQVAAAAHRVEFLQFVAGDSVERLMISGDATVTGLELGPGNATRDIRLFRNAGGNLGLNSAGAAVQTTFQINSTAGQRAAIGISVTGDAANRLALFGDATNAEIQWGPGSAARDLRLYRSAAKVLTLDDTAGGGVTLNVVNALQVGGTAVSLVGHGPADHADRTQTIMLSPNAASLDGATLIAVGASPQLSPAINYADAATSGAYWIVTLPDYAGGVAVNIRPLWTPAATDAVAHTVRWSVTAKEMASASDITAAGTTTAFTGTSAARTVNIAVTENAQSTGVTPAAGAPRMRIELQRIGADAADTYVGAVRLFALLVEYTSTQ